MELNEYIYFQKTNLTLLRFEIILCLINVTLGFQQTVGHRKLFKLTYFQTGCLTLGVMCFPTLSSFCKQTCNMIHLTAPQLLPNYHLSCLLTALNRRYCCMELTPSLDGSCGALSKIVKERSRLFLPYQVLLPNFFCFTPSQGRSFILREPRAEQWEPFTPNAGIKGGGGGRAKSVENLKVIKLNKSQSALCYHHAILNSVGVKIPLPFPHIILLV